MPFSMEELITAVEAIKEEKAPGIDGIPPEAVKTAAKEAPGMVLVFMNKLLRTQKFPDRRKAAKLVHIPKGGDREEKAYRPICLLSCLSKLYERMLTNILEREIERRGGGLSQHQYGFRKVRSNIQAVMHVWEVLRRCSNKRFTLIAIDVKNTAK